MTRNKWVRNDHFENNNVIATNKWIGKYYVGADGIWIR